jgi:uncharacterized SAM-dependent methyltransferase
LRPASGVAHEDVLAALAGRPRRLPSRLVYDRRGFELLDAVCRSAAYYPARLERGLLADHAGDLRELAGPHARVIEPWHGDVARSIAMLGVLDRPAQYVPIDGDPVRLAATVQTVRAALPDLDVRPAVTLDEVLPRAGGFERTLACLPGTTIGSLDPSHAVRLMTLLAALVGDDGALVLGADATSDPDPLRAAYGGEAAATWLVHALTHVSADAGAFAYACAWNPAATRLDLTLVATRPTSIEVAGNRFEIAIGESIIVDQRHQHTTEAMQAMLGIAGWQARRTFTANPEPMRIWLCDRWRRSRRR